MRFVSIGVVAALLAPAVAPAASIYVNNITGNDRATGLAPVFRTDFDGPVASIRRALELARSSDVIEIAHTDVPYTEPVLVDRPALFGTDAYPFLIEGHGATIHGARPVPASVWRYVGDGVYRYQPYRKGHGQLILAGAPAREVPVTPTETVPPHLEPLEWCAVHGFVYFRVEPGRYIEQYDIEAPLFDIGLGLHNMRHVEVRNLRVEFFRLDGIHVSGTSRDIRLFNIDSTGNGRAGLAVGGTSRSDVGGLSLEGNRISDRLMFLKGVVNEVPAADVPPRPVPIAWEFTSGRYVRLLLTHPTDPPTATARRSDDDRTTR
jgi:hypothetical protein